MSDLRTALEQALVDNPDDLGTHMAYADYLQEQEDPRGDLIQVQLALEDEKKSAAQRKKLQQREKELLEAHEREWLGELAPLLLGTPEEQRAMFAAELKRQYKSRLDDATENMHFRHGWRRGWLDRFECQSMTVEMVRKLGRAPIARLLGAFISRGGWGADVFRYAKGPDITRKMARGNFYPCEVLASYPAIRNLGVFQYGQEVDPEEDSYSSGTQFRRLAPLIERMPRIEELYIFGHIYFHDEQRADLGRIFSLETLQNLRVLQYYHGHVYPLEVLAANPSLGHLTHLLCFPHYGAGEYDLKARRYTSAAITRDRVRAIVTSPHLHSLTHLQLRCCDGGDDMVADIVTSRILGRLKMLDLRHGHVTDKGARQLASQRKARNLEVLDLTNNRLTERGIKALQGAGIPVRAERQQNEPYEDDHILYFGDSE